VSVAETVEAVMDDICIKVEEAGMVEEIDGEQTEDDGEQTEDDEEQIPVSSESPIPDEGIVEKKFPKMGIYQGVKYMFGEETNHGEHPVMIMEWGDKKEVGMWTDDEVILKEDYEKTHEFSATDPEQEDVIWL
jgi:hypothetical protein